MKTGIIFDMDGTLLDTLEDLRDATNYALEQFGYPPRTLGEVRRFVGNGALQLIQLAVPEGADPMPVLKEFQAYYKEHCQIKTRLYDGIPEAVAALGEKYPLAVVSNKPNFAAKAMCQVLFPGVYALGEEAGTPRKPAPDMVFKAMEAIGVDRCVYVGDSEVDVLTAKNANVPCLSVLWGFRDREMIEEAGAAHFCPMPADLLKCLKEMIEIYGK